MTDRARDDAKLRWQMVALGMIDEAGKTWLQEVARKIVAVADEPANYRRQMITEAVGLSGKPTRTVDFVSLVDVVSVVEQITDAQPESSETRGKTAARIVAECMRWTVGESDPDAAKADAAIRSDAEYRARIETLLGRDPETWGWFVEVEHRRRSLTG